MIKKTLFLIILCILTTRFTAYSAGHIALKKSDDVVTKKATTNELVKSYLELTSFRHKVLAENIANVNIPGYKAKEVRTPKSYDELIQKSDSIKSVRLTITTGRHIGNGREAVGKFTSYKIKDPHEIKPNGNNVSLAQQMTKISQNQQDYNAAIKLYTAMNGLVSVAVGK